jgi:hypothetical protein
MSAKSIKIEVTQKDIDHGCRFDGCRCPIARALKRCTDEQWLVNCSNLIRKTFPMLTIPTPPEMKSFANMFDLDLPVHPTTFELEIPG